MKMKMKRFITLGAVALCVALMSGISYAWFTDQAKTSLTSVDAGYLDISLTGVPDDADSIFPAEKIKTIEYTITNESSVTVIAQFKAGTLTAYVMPTDYMKDGFVLDDYRDALKAMTFEEKLAAFTLKSNLGSDVVAGMVLTAANTADGGWTLTGTGSEYLGKDAAGNQYFRLAALGTATCDFEIGLASTAGNEYQYALLSLDEAAVLVTQDNDAAFLSTFGIDRSTVVK